MMLTIDQLSYLLKFALQKMKQPGVSILLPLCFQKFVLLKSLKAQISFSCVCSHAVYHWDFGISSLLTSGDF